jgi:hypothetical protein
VTSRAADRSPHGAGLAEGRAVDPAGSCALYALDCSKKKAAAAAIRLSRACEGGALAAERHEPRRGGPPPGFWTARAGGGGAPAAMRAIFRPGGRRRRLASALAAAFFPLDALLGRCRFSLTLAGNGSQLKPVQALHWHPELQPFTRLFPGWTPLSHWSGICTLPSDVRTQSLKQVPLQPPPLSVPLSSHSSLASSTRSSHAAVEARAWTAPAVFCFCFL